MNILAIGAHPDDIEFGCGGTLSKYSEKGHKVYMLVLSKGDKGGILMSGRKNRKTQHEY